MGDIGTPAEVGAELDGPGAVKVEPADPRWDLVVSDEDNGVNSLPWEVVDSRLVTMGRKRSRVKSNISDPIAPIAAEYRSRLIRDSLTMNSAKSLTLSASFGAADSF